MPVPRPERGLGFQPKSLWDGRNAQVSRLGNRWAPPTAYETRAGCPCHVRNVAWASSPRACGMGGTPRHQASEIDGHRPWHMRHGQDARATECGCKLLLCRYANVSHQALCFRPPRGLSPALDAGGVHLLSDFPSGRCGAPTAAQRLEGGALGDAGRGASTHGRFAGRTAPAH